MSNPATTPTTEVTVMSTINVSVIASQPAEAEGKLATLLTKKVPGFILTGKVEQHPKRAIFWTVEVEDRGGDRDDLWFWTTSYGMSPEAGTSKFGDALDAFAG